MGSASDRTKIADKNNIARHLRAFLLFQNSGRLPQCLNGDEQFFRYLGVEFNRLNPNLVLIASAGGLELIAMQAAIDFA